MADSESVTLQGPLREGKPQVTNGEFPTVDLSLVLDRLNLAQTAIAAVMIVALLVLLLCIGMTALIRSKPENIPETLHGIAAIFRALRNPWRRETSTPLDKQSPPRRAPVVSALWSERLRRRRPG